MSDILTADMKRKAAIVLMNAYIDAMADIDSLTCNGLDDATECEALRVLKALKDTSDKWNGETTCVDTLKQKRTAAGFAAIPSMKFQAPFKLQGDGRPSASDCEDYDEEGRIGFAVSFEKTEAADEDNYYNDMLARIYIWFAPGTTDIVRVEARVTDNDSILDDREIPLAAPELVAA
jgi:hypothetical protein